MKRRKGVRPISAKRLAYLEELQRQLPHLFAGCGGVCEVCGSAPVAHAHHKLRRSQGGTNELDNLIGVCLDCHQDIHAHPERSYRLGYLTRGQSGHKV